MKKRVVTVVAASLVLFMVAYLGNLLAAGPQTCCVIQQGKDRGCSKEASEADCSGGEFFQQSCDTIDICTKQGCCVSFKDCSMKYKIVCEGSDAYYFDETIMDEDECRLKYCLIESPSIPDSDGDGVPDHMDTCRDSRKGVSVGDNGCEVAGEADIAPADTCESLGGYCISTPNYNTLLRQHGTKAAGRVGGSCDSGFCIRCLSCFRWDDEAQQCVKYRDVGKRDCENCIDDDNDGLVDYPEDPGCTSLHDPHEKKANLECDDGIDNDLDGFADLLDKDCQDVRDPMEGVECDPNIAGAEMGGITAESQSGILLNWRTEAPHSYAFRSEHQGWGYKLLDWSSSGIEYGPSCRECYFLDQEVMPGRTYYYYVNTAKMENGETIFSCSQSEVLSIKAGCPQGLSLVCNDVTPGDCACCDSGNYRVKNGICYGDVPCDYDSPITLFSQSYNSCDAELVFGFRDRFPQYHGFGFLIPIDAIVTRATFSVSNEEEFPALPSGMPSKGVDVTK